MTAADHIRLLRRCLATQDRRAVTVPRAALAAALALADFGADLVAAAVEMREERDA